MSELQQLKDQLKTLQEDVSKQKKVLQKTTQQLLEYQVEDTRRKLQELPTPNAEIDLSDYTTNDDIIQLVGELQGQLDIVEERAIRRTANSTITLDSERKLAPLRNNDGEELLDFPTTLKQFSEIDDDLLIELLRFYDLLPLTSAEKNQYQEFIDGSVDVPTLQVDVSSSDFSKKELDELFDTLARYIGVTFRRGDSW
ncbi:hypothetical protein LJB42_003457 [Komagataella kurtzmanii]|nr:hypothetical protein LJB42_003457 [Komagataella kurtzmanii]